MFSRTTIESSTTRPIETVSAPRVRMFSEYPPPYNPSNAITSENGMDSAVTTVDRTESRKTRMTRIAIPSPSSPSSVSAVMDSWMNGAWSNTTVNRVSSPRSSSRSATDSETSSATVTVLASVSLVTLRPTDGSEFARVIEVDSVRPSRTLATSPSWTGSGVCAVSGGIPVSPVSGGTPVWSGTPVSPVGGLAPPAAAPPVGMIGSWRSSFTEEKLEPTSTAAVLLSSVSSPPGTLIPFAASALVTASAVRPFSVSSS